MESFADRQGDWGRHMALYAGRLRCGLTLKELGAYAGMNTPAVCQSALRVKRRLENDAARKKDFTGVLSLLNETDYGWFMPVCQILINDPETPVDYPETPVYYNLRHGRSGHLFQGRFGSKLVEGDSYLLSLTRYVHLNPVCVSAVERLPLKARVAHLNQYRWSSYRGYVDERKALGFVDYGPVLAVMDGRGRKAVSRRYRKFVEEGMIRTDEEFVKVKNSSRYAIGSPEFESHIRGLYRKMVEGRAIVEDVSFRRQIEPLPVETVVRTVCNVLDVKESEVYIRRRGSLVRPAAARMLCKFAGLTQREVAGILNLGSGVAVSCQLRKLQEAAVEKEDVKIKLKEMSRRLQSRQNSRVLNFYSKV